ncbi:MAG: hypothetical protein IJS33_01720 [Firmicutes bacterium]|nr:hypothetical protein [Bacillota bacterium]
MDNSDTNKSIVEEYIESVDTEIVEFINSVIEGKAAKKYVRVAEISDRLASDIFELTGKQIKENLVILDSNAIKHIVKRHGIDGAQDQSMADIRDIARMGYVIRNYDQVLFDGRASTGYVDENQQASPMMTIKKRINGTYYIITATGSVANKRSYIVSAYITKA